MRNVGLVACGVGGLQAPHLRVGLDFQRAVQDRQMLARARLVGIRYQCAAWLQRQFVPFELTGQLDGPPDTQLILRLMAVERGDFMRACDGDRFMGVRGGEQLVEADAQRVRQAPCHGDRRVGFVTLDFGQHGLRYPGGSRQIVERQLALRAQPLNLLTDAWRR